MGTQREENDALLKEYRECTSARRKSQLEGIIVQKNLPFVKNKARKFVQRSHVELDIEDVLQAGAIGLITAIRKDQGKSAFSTYAAWWILHEFQNLAVKTHPVRRPKGAGMAYKNYRAAEAFKAITGDDPTDEDLGLPEGSVDAWRQSPVFYQLDDNCDSGEHPEEKFSCQQPLAEEVLGQLEENNELYKALSSLTEDEQVLLEKWLDGKRPGSKAELVESIFDKLHAFLVS